MPGGRPPLPPGESARRKRERDRSRYASLSDAERAVLADRQAARRRARGEDHRQRERERMRAYRLKRVQDVLEVSETPMPCKATPVRSLADAYNTDGSDATDLVELQGQQALKRAYQAGTVAQGSMQVCPGTPKMFLPSCAARPASSAGAWKTAMRIVASSASVSIQRGLPASLERQDVSKKAAVLARPRQSAGWTEGLRKDGVGMGGECGMSWREQVSSEEHIAALGLLSLRQKEGFC
jgi:hypothetical protein